MHLIIRLVFAVVALHKKLGHTVLPDSAAEGVLPRRKHK